MEKCVVKIQIPSGGFGVCLGFPVLGELACAHGFLCTLEVGWARRADLDSAVPSLVAKLLKSLPFQQ